MTTAWPEVRLDSIAEVRLGRQRSPKDHDGPSMRPYVRAANVGWSGLLLDDVKCMNFTNDELDIYGLRPGDLLLNEASGSQREVGKPAIWNGEIANCAFQNTLLRVRPFDAHPRYLLHFFKQQASTGAFARRARGVGIRHLGREALASLTVPLPPIEEQRRIAAVLDHTHTLRARRKESLPLLNALTVSVFEETFGGAVRPPVPLRELLVDSTIGLIRGSKDLGSEHPYPYIRMNAIGRDGELDLTDLRRTWAEDDEVARYSVRRGDLLFNTRNTRELVGKTAIVRSDKRMLFNNNVMRLRFSSRVEPEYAVAVIRQPFVQAQLNQRKSGTTSVCAIYAKDLLTVSIPVPPLDLQREFSTAIESIRRSAASSEVHAEQLDELFASLQRRAFAGAL